MSSMMDFGSQYYVVYLKVAKSSYHKEKIVTMS